MTPVCAYYYYNYSYFYNYNYEYNYSYNYEYSCHRILKAFGANEIEREHGHKFFFLAPTIS